MKTISLFAFSLAVLPTCAWGAGSVLGTVDCRDPQWPSLGQVAQAVGMDALDPVDRVRHRMKIETLRACRQGAHTVQLVLDDPRRIERLRVVAGIPAMEQP